MAIKKSQKIEVVDNDAGGKAGGTLYRITTTVDVRITELLEMDEAQAMAAFHPGSAIAHIRGSIVKGRT